MTALRTCLFIIFVWLAPHLSAQVYMRPFDNAAALGIGGAAIAQPDLAAGFVNDAQVATVQKPTALLSAALPYTVSNWQSLHLQAVIPTRQQGAWGVTAQHAALPTYAEQQVQLTYARALGRNWQLGVSALGLRASAPEYGAHTGLSASVGVLANALPNVWLGAQIHRPFVAFSGKTTVPPALRFGGCWQAAKTARILAEVEKEQNSPAQIKAGLEYRPVPAIAVRFGTRTQPAQPTLGAQWQPSTQLAIDVASAWHPALGLTPAVMVRWQGKGRANAGK